MLTVSILRACGVSAKEATEERAAALTAAMAEFHIDTRTRAVQFLAQVLHESGGLRYWRELWGPTPAQRGYEGRHDLGNTQPGDGKRFLGRGPIQITGRANYAAAGHAVGIDLQASPTLAEGAVVGSRIAGWFWASHGLNAVADRADHEDAAEVCKRITRVVNGGYNGLADRQAWRVKVQHALVAGWTPATATGYRLILGGHDRGPMVLRDNTSYVNVAAWCRWLGIDRQAPGLPPTMDASLRDLVAFSGLDLDVDEDARVVTVTRRV